MSQEWISKSLRHKQQTFKSQEDTSRLLHGDSEFNICLERKESSIHQILQKESTYSPKKSHFSGKNTLGVVNNGHNGGFDLTLQKINNGSCATSGRENSGN